MRWTPAVGWSRLIGSWVTVPIDDRTPCVVQPLTGDVFTEHTAVTPGETSILDDHFGGPRPDKTRRPARPSVGGAHGGVRDLDGIPHA